MIVICRKSVWLWLTVSNNVLLENKKIVKIFIWAIYMGRHDNLIFRANSHPLIISILNLEFPFDGCQWGWVVNTFLGQMMINIVVAGNRVWSFSVVFWMPVNLQKHYFRFVSGEVWAPLSSALSAQCINWVMEAAGRESAPQPYVYLAREAVISSVLYITSLWPWREYWKPMIFQVLKLTTKYNWPFHPMGGT